MVLSRALRSHHFYTFLRHENTSLLVRNSLCSSSSSIDSTFADFQKRGSRSRYSSFLISSIFRRTLSASLHFEERTETELTDSENDELTKKSVKRSEKKIKETKRKKKKTLKEDEVPKDQSKPKSLYALFAIKSAYVKKSAVYNRERISSYGESESLKKDPPHHRELSPEMVSLVSRLHKEEYLNYANFLPRKELDLSCFSNNYSRDFLRFAAERFGRDHQEIAKWLSGSELKKVALFGCPSVEKKIAFAAKRLRTFFRIQEDTVCRICKLKESCKLVNKRVWNVGSNLNLADVMIVLTVYDLESVHSELVVPNEIKASISRLLNEVLNLTQ